MLSPIALHARAGKPDVVAGLRIGITKAVELPWRYGAERFEVSQQAVLMKEWIASSPSLSELRRTESLFELRRTSRSSAMSCHRPA
jgi:hypothetical protein